MSTLVINHGAGAEERALDVVRELLKDWDVEPIAGRGLVWLESHPYDPAWILEAASDPDRLTRVFEDWLELRNAPRRMSRRPRCLPRECAVVALILLVAFALGCDTPSAARTGLGRSVPAALLSLLIWRAHLERAEQFPSRLRSRG